MLKLTLQRVHCGCIISVNTFTLLDAGGIECMTCARKNLLLVRMNLADSHYVYIFFWLYSLPIMPFLDTDQLIFLSLIDDTKHSLIKTVSLVFCILITTTNIV